MGGLEDLAGWTLGQNVGILVLMLWFEEFSRQRLDLLTYLLAFQNARNCVSCRRGGLTDVAGFHGPTITNAEGKLIVQT